MLFPSVPEIFVVRAGTLDEPEGYRPRMVLWTSAGPTWDRIDPDVPTVEKMPPMAAG